MPFVYPLKATAVLPVCTNLQFFIEKGETLEHNTVLPDSFVPSVLACCFYNEIHFSNTCHIFFDTKPKTLFEYFMVLRGCVLRVPALLMRLEIPIIITNSVDLLLEYTRRKA